MCSSIKAAGHGYGRRQIPSGGSSPRFFSKSKKLTIGDMSNLAHSRGICVYRFRNRYGADKTSLDKSYERASLSTNLHFSFLLLSQVAEFYPQGQIEDFPPVLPEQNKINSRHIFRASPHTPCCTPGYTPGCTL
jgi:hypothetical protein